MSVYVRNLTLDTHSDFSERFELMTAGDQPLDLSNYTIHSQIRKVASSVGFTSMTVGITSAADGELTLSIGSTDTGNMKPGRYVYDVLAVSGTNTKSIVVEGTVMVRQGITTN
jgi:hypothetical protein